RLKPFQFVDTRRAPRRPKVQHKWLSVLRNQSEVFAAHRCHIQLWRRPRDECRFVVLVVKYTLAHALRPAYHLLAASHLQFNPQPLHRLARRALRLAWSRRSLYIRVKCLAPSPARKTNAPSETPSHAASRPQPLLSPSPSASEFPRATPRPIPF